MKTFLQFAEKSLEIPLASSWMSSDIAEMKGRQQLFMKQSPQKLKVLREHSIIESAVSSNRIEGVEIDNKRIGTVIFGKKQLKDRNEEEIRGYREALNLIHRNPEKLTLDAELICRLHKMIHGQIWDAGKFKEKDGDIIETFSNGDKRIRFKTIPAKDTADCLKQTLDLYHNAVQEQKIPPLLAVTAFNLDFLCIHPFRDGNGRVSRLLLLLGLYHCGIDAGRYISLEKDIENNKSQYYETLELSSRGWHEGKHDPWPYLNYLLFTVKNIFRDFEARIGQMTSQRGAKTEMIVKTINEGGDTFSVSQLEQKCPGVSRDMIRRILKQHRETGNLKCEGKGPGAIWKRIRVLPL